MGDPPRAGLSISAKRGDPMRNAHDMGASPLKAAARDLALASNRIGIAATAVVLAATVVIAIVAPI